MLQKYKEQATPIEKELIAIFEQIKEPDLLFVYSIDLLIETCQNVKPFEESFIRSFVLNYSAFVSNEMTKQQTAFDLLEDDNSPLSYGILSFDTYLPPLKSSGIIEIAGEAGAGKSQLCMQIMVLASLCYKMPCYYICDKRFVYEERIKSMEEYYSQLLGFGMVNVNTHIFVRKTSTFKEFTQSLSDIIEKQEDGLVIVDCFGSILKTSFENNYTERGSGTSFAAALFGELITKGFIVITTNEAADKIETSEMVPFDFLSLDTELKSIPVSSGLDLNCDGKIMTTPSGIQWAYYVSYRLFVYKTEESIYNVWETLSESTKEELQELTEDMKRNVKIRKCVINKSNETEKGICLEYCILTSHVCGIERIQ